MTTVSVIGGSGVYAVEGLTGVKEHQIQTPFGSPSDAVVEGYLGATRLLFLARHGKKHSLLPSEVNSRANIWALKSLGAEWCIGITAVGSLREELSPGMVVVPDQILDRTRNRPSTFFGRGLVAHVSFGTPYCPVLRQIVFETATRVHPGKAHNLGTYVCMEGPAFSTRAESEMYRTLGGAVIGMTALPEAKLAREAEISYTSLCLVTDYDCWRAHEEEVDVHDVVTVLKANSNLAKEIVKSALPLIEKATPSRHARHALDNAILSDIGAIPPDTLVSLEPILRRRLNLKPQPTAV